MTNSPEYLIYKLYNLTYIGDKKRVYNLFSKDFKNLYSLNSFLTYQKCKVLDIVVLSEVVKIQEIDNFIEVLTKIQIGGEFKTHNYKTVKEDGDYKLIFSRFFIHN